MNMKITLRSGRSWWRPWPIIILAAGLYLATLDNGLRPDELTGGDLITHQYAQVQARPGNAPGYPLYTMLGWLWFRIGRFLLAWLLNPIQILSLYSTLWGLASLWLLFQLLYRADVTGSDWLLSAGLTLFYGTGYFFWYYSVTTEQYTSAIFQTLLLVWLALRWEKQPHNRLLLLMAFISGTMLANMLTTLFILPPLGYLIFTRRPDIFKKMGLIGQTVLVGLLPLVSYLYIYLRGAAHPEWRGQGQWAGPVDWFWHFVSTQQGRDELAPGLSLQNLITPEFPALIWGELTWPILIGGLIGLTLFGRRLAIFFFGTLVIYLIFVTGYRFGNWFQVILPFYPLLIVGFGRSMARLWQRFPHPAVKAGSLGLLLLLLGWRAGLNFSPANQHDRPDDTGLEPGWAILASVAEPGWAISPTFAEWLAGQYLSEIWQAEPAVQLVSPGQPAEFITRRAAAAYPELIDPAVDHPGAVGGNLIRRQPPPTTTLSDIPGSLPVDLAFGEQLYLAGYGPAEDGQTIMLYWTARQPLPTDYTISVRLWQHGQPLQTAAGPLIQDHQPVWNTYPTSLWPPGQIIADAYTFPSLAAARPDQMQIVVYQAKDGGFENLAVQMVDLVQP